MQFPGKKPQLNGRSALPSGSDRARRRAVTRFAWENVTAPRELRATGEGNPQSASEGMKTSEQEKTEITSRFGIGTVQNPQSAIRNRVAARQSLALPCPALPSMIHSSKRAWANCLGSKGCRSSGFSPKPMYLTGRASSFWMATTMPPLLVPSSLVMTRPVRGTAL